MYKVLISHLQIKTIHKSLLTAYKHACQARHDLHVNHSENDPLAQKEPLGLIFSAAGHQWITSVYQPILVDFEPGGCWFSYIKHHQIQQEHGIDMVHYHHDFLATYLGKSMGKNQWNINHLWRLGVNAFWHFAPRGDSQIPIPMLSSLIPSLAPLRSLTGKRKQWKYRGANFMDVIVWKIWGC